MSLFTYTPLPCDRLLVYRTFDLNDSIYNPAQFHKNPNKQPADNTVISCEDLSSMVLNPTRKRVDEAVHEKILSDNEALSRRYNPVAFALFEKYSKQFDEQYHRWVESDYSIVF